MRIRRSSTSIRTVEWPRNVIRACSGPGAFAGAPARTGAPGGIERRHDGRAWVHRAPDRRSAAGRRAAVAPSGEMPHLDSVPPQPPQPPKRTRLRARPRPRRRSHRRNSPVAGAGGRPRTARSARPGSGPNGPPGAPIVPRGGSTRPRRGRPASRTGTQQIVDAAGDVGTAVLTAVSAAADEAGARLAAKARPARARAGADHRPCGRAGRHLAADPGGGPEARVEGRAGSSGVVVRPRRSG